MTPSPGKILLIDNDPQSLRFLTAALEATGYTSICTRSGEEALRFAASLQPDAILLDLTLPDMDGQEVLVKLREFTNAPIIIVSARSYEVDKVKALDAGADDYIKKPFQLGELQARIRTSLRHRHARRGGDKPITLGAFSIDPIAYRVKLRGEMVALTKHEHALLLLLTHNLDSVLTRGQILTEIWGQSHSNDIAYLRVYIGRLRAKLGPEFAPLIITESGVGYRMQNPLALERLSSFDPCGGRAVTTIADAANPRVRRG
jgi:two-component system KDP operon response regulator KdpE